MLAGTICLQPGLVSAAPDTARTRNAKAPTNSPPKSKSRGRVRLGRTTVMVLDVDENVTDAFERRHQRRQRTSRVATPGTQAVKPAALPGHELSFRGAHTRGGPGQPEGTGKRIISVPLGQRAAQPTKKEALPPHRSRPSARTLGPDQGRLPMSERLRYTSTAASSRRAPGGEHPLPSSKSSTKTASARQISKDSPPPQRNGVPVDQGPPLPSTAALKHPRRLPPGRPLGHPMAFPRQPAPASKEPRLPTTSERTVGRPYKTPQKTGTKASRSNAEKPNSAGNNRERLRRRKRL